MRRLAPLLLLLLPTPARADDAAAAASALALAESAWTRSCPDAGTDDCLRIDVVTSAHHCGGRYTRIRSRRTPAAAARAQRQITAALARIDLLPDSERAAAADARARALLIAAEPRFEELMSMTFPANLRFDERGRKRSLAAFQDWLRKLERAGMAARSGYHKIADDAAVPVDLQLAARARVGQMLERAADLHAHAAIPPDVRGGPYGAEASEAYCDALDEHAEPLRAQARQTFTDCVQAADAVAATGRWPDACRAGLARLP